MGRKGVSKRKKVNGKVLPAANNNAAGSGRKAERQPDLVTEKAKTWSKDKKKH